MCATPEALQPVGQDVLALASITSSNETGAAMHAEAQRILALAGQAHSGTISLGQSAGPADRFARHALERGWQPEQPAKLLADAPGTRPGPAHHGQIGASTGCDLASPA